MGNWLFRAVKGAIIGVGAILPGISGGVLSVVLGIYKPMMAFLAHPLRGFRENAALLLPVLIGWALGVIGLSKAVDWLFRTYEIPAIWFFIGLVAGTLPQLFKEAGEKGRPAAAYIALAAGGLLMGGLLFLLSRGESLRVTPSIPWWLLCGALWGIGLVVPGMSPSSFLIFLGLYQPMTAGIGSLDFSVVLPMGLGLLAAVALLARVINALLNRHYAIFMHAIVGVVIASTLAILPLGAPGGPGNIALYAACFLGGCALAFGLDRLGRRMRAEGEEEGGNGRGALGR